MNEITYNIYTVGGPIKFLHLDDIDYSNKIIEEFNKNGNGINNLWSLVNSK